MYSQSLIYIYHIIIYYRHNLILQMLCDVLSLFYITFSPSYNIPILVLRTMKHPHIIYYNILLNAILNSYYRYIAIILHLQTV